MMDEDKDIRNKHSLFTVSSAFPQSLFSLDSLSLERPAGLRGDNCIAPCVSSSVANWSLYGKPRKPITLPDSKIILRLLSVLSSLNKEMNVATVAQLHICVADWAEQKGAVK